MSEAEAAVTDEKPKVEGEAAAEEGAPEGGEGEKKEEAPPVE